MTKKFMFTNSALSNMVYSATEFVANKNYEDTQMKQAFVINANSLGYTYGDDDRPLRVMKAFFTAVSAYLSKNKIAKTDEATALVLTDTAGNFKFGAIVQYHENTENPDEPGNWSYTMTLNEEDLQDLERTKTVKKLLVGDMAFQSTMDKAAYDVAGIMFKHDSYIFDACTLCIETIIQVLDAEAKPNEVVDIEMPGYFVASVAIENGEKVFSIVPDGHMKSIIKEDVALED